MQDDDSGSSQPLGFFGQLRAQHWAVKIILGFVVLMMASPFLAIGGTAAYQVAGSAGAMAFVILIAVGFGWFVFTKPKGSARLQTAPPPPAALPSAAARAPQRSPFGTTQLTAMPHYCESCGASFASHLATCPECHRHYQDVRTESIRAIARYLNQLTRDRQRGLLDQSSFRRLSDEYQRQLWVLRPAPPPPMAEGPAIPPPPAGATPVVGAPPPPTGAPVQRPAAAIPARQPAPAAPAVVRPPKVAEPRPSAADMGRAVTGWAAEREADILLYVGAFLLSVAAIIFVAYQGEELSGNIRFAVLTAYAVGFLGFGLFLHRWERVKEAGPAFLALGAILFPLDFIALRTQVLDQGQVSQDVLWLIASASTAALYFVLAFRGFGRFYFLPAIPATLIAWGSLGSVLNLPNEWFGPWYAGIAAPAYVTATALIGRWRPAPWMLWVSVAIGAAAVGWTHVVSGAGDGDNTAVPVVYALATAAIAVALRWRVAVPALAVLSPLAATTAATAWWAAFGLGYEWQPLFAALAAAGYLITAHFQPERAAPNWGTVASMFALAALAGGHLAMLGDTHDRSALPATYATVFVVAAGAYARWSWTAVATALPLLGGMTLLTAAWASGEVAVEWYGALVVLAAYGYLALAAFDPGHRTARWQTAATVTALIGPLLAHATVGLDDDAQRWALPVTHGLVLLGAAVSFAGWRWSWRVAPAAIPAAAALTAITAAWAQWDLQPEWYPAFAAAAGLGYLLLGHFDTPQLARAWGGAALSAGVLAIATAHNEVLQPGADRWALPVSYGLALAGVVAAHARWRWSLSAALLPPAAGMLALTASWARWDIQPEWFASFAAAASLGYLLLARFEREERRQYWWAGSILFAAGALAGAHVVVGGRPEAENLALPLPYAILTAGAAIAFAVWRYIWRVAPAVLPALAAMTAITGLWAQWEPQYAWHGTIAVAATFGYIAFALTDEQRWARPWLGFALLAGMAGVAFTQLAQVAESDLAPAANALPVAYGGALVAAAFASGWWRWRCREAVALVPPLAAAFGASLLWATNDMRLEWLTAWAAAAGAGYLVPALLDARFRSNWQAGALLAGLLALGAAHAVALAEDAVRWQLPLSYAISLAAWSALAIRLRDASTLMPPLLAALLGASALWAAGVEPRWWPYPALAVAAILVATARWWQPNRVLGAAGWGYAVALTVVPALAVLPVDYTHHDHGLAVQVIAAVLLFVAALGSRGRVFQLFAANPTDTARSAEWAILLQVAFAFLFGAAASLNGVLELTGGERAWAFAGLGAAGWWLVASRWRGAAGLFAFAPIGLVGATVSSLVAGEHPATLTGVLALATAGPLIAYAGIHRWTLIGVANSFLFLAIWAAWRWQDLSMTYLPLAFAAVAALEWTALAALRRYERAPSERGMVIEYMSWGPWLLSATVSGILLSRESSRLDPGTVLVTTDEWALAAAVFGLAAAAVTAEGLRLHRRWVWIVGGAGLLGALLMAIATRQPENIQAYTAPRASTSPSSRSPSEGRHPSSSSTCTSTKRSCSSACCSWSSRPPNRASNRAAASTASNSSVSGFSSSPWAYCSTDAGSSRVQS